MREEDFVAELDAHMKYQLKVTHDPIAFATACFTLPFQFQL